MPFRSDDATRRVFCFRRFFFRCLLVWLLVFLYYSISGYGMMWRRDAAGISNVCISPCRMSTTMPSMMPMKVSHWISSVGLDALSGDWLFLIKGFRTGVRPSTRVPFCRLKIDFYCSWSMQIERLSIASYNILTRWGTFKVDGLTRVGGSRSNNVERRRTCEWSADCLVPALLLPQSAPCYLFTSQRMCRSYILFW